MYLSRPLPALQWYSVAFNSVSVVWQGGDYALYSGLLRLVVVSIYSGGVLRCMLHQPSRSAAGLMIDGARALTLAGNGIPKRDLAIAHTKAAALQD